MIVLDEQLLGRGLEREIASWYHGTVVFITDLRPHTVIKDDAIPALLHGQNQATFVTINEQDFWRQVAIDPRFCIVCVVLLDSHAEEISPLLRSLFRRPHFRSKARRMGKVIRIADGLVTYYAYDDKSLRTARLKLG